MKRLSSFYEIAQFTLQGQSKGCLKVRISIFLVIFKTLFCVQDLKTVKISLAQVALQVPGPGSARSRAKNISARQDIG